MYPFLYPPAHGGLVVSSPAQEGLHSARRSQPLGHGPLWSTLPERASPRGPASFLLETATTEDRAGTLHACSATSATHHWFEGNGANWLPIQGLLPLGKDGSCIALGGSCYKPPRVPASREWQDALTGAATGLLDLGKAQFSHPLGPACIACSDCCFCAPKRTGALGRKQSKSGDELRAP